MNVLLLIVGAVIAISVFVGYRKGLVRIIASLLATVLIVTLVGVIAPYMSKWIQQRTPLKERIHEKVVEMLLSENDENVDESLLNQEIAKEQQITLLENAKVPDMLRQSLLENNNYEAYARLGVESFGEYVGAYIAKVISDILAFLIALIIVTIAVGILIKMLGLIDKLPLIGGMNRVAGGAVGIGIGIMVVWVLFLVIVLFYDTSMGKACFEQIEGNKILSYLYSSNPLMKYVMRF